MRIDSDACLPLFTRTARFDIQPNRFGILGQFGPERKLQLTTVNVSSLIGWDGKVIPNASVEMEVYEIKNLIYATESFPKNTFEVLDLGGRVLPSDIGCELKEDGNPDANALFRELQKDMLPKLKRLRL